MFYPLNLGNFDEGRATNSFHGFLNLWTLASLHKASLRLRKYSNCYQSDYIAHTKRFDNGKFALSAIFWNFEDGYSSLAIDLWL